MAIDGQLSRTLGPWQALSVVVGTIIGTGIFLKTATMAQFVGGINAIALVWICAGILSFAGSLTYAELSSAIPEAGGEYSFLKWGYGPIAAFLFGWMRFWIASPGSIAAYAVGAATFLNAVVPLDFIYGGIKSAAFIFIILFSIINCFHVHWGARVQTFLTILKSVLILGLIIGVFGWGKEIETTDLSLNFNGWLTSSANQKFLWSSFGLAMISALWAYDGWNNLPMIGEEIKNPQKNIPMALGFGLLIVLFLYLTINFAFFHVLTLEEIQGANSSKYPEALPVATLAAQSFLNQFGIPVISIAFVISALGAMNGSILTVSRIPFAMARDGIFFKGLSVVTASGLVPARAIIIQGLLASLFAVLGTFDQLTDYVVVSSWIFYALTASLIYKLRKENKEKQESSHNSFKLPGYPIVPFLFILTSIFLVINSFIQNPINAIYGLSIILMGVPYYYWNKFKK